MEGLSRYVCSFPIVNFHDHVTQVSQVVSSTFYSNISFSFFPLFVSNTQYKTTELEDFLIKNRDEYLSFSAKNYTIEQRDYNNRLTSQCLEYSIQCGYSDLFQDSVFASVRDRIRSYYKSYVQSFKRRRERQQKQEQKTHQYEQQQEQQGQLPTINTTMVNNNNSSW